MTRSLQVHPQRSLIRFLCAVTALCLPSKAVFAQLPVLTEDYESYALGSFGTVSDFSDATYLGANSAASIVAGQALQFSFDVKSGMGALNTNVEAPFPGLATNNSSANIADYTLEFDLSMPAGTTTGWFGVVEVATPGSGPRTQGLNLAGLTVGGPAVHHSMSLATMGQPFGTVIDPTNPNWVVRLVALGFPANGGGVRTTLQLDNVRVTAVPEPGSLVLALASMLGLASVRRRPSRG